MPRRFKCRAIWNVFVIFLVLISTNVAESQSIDRVRHRQSIPLHRTNVQSSTNSQSVFQNSVEQLLRYGGELRRQILNTLGKWVYDKYDELSIDQLEFLYRIYHDTFRRKYNILEVGPSLLWQSRGLRTNDICKAVNENVCTYVKGTSEICANIEPLNQRRSSIASTVADIYQAIEKYFPRGITLSALLRHIQKRNLQITPKLLIGLLLNIPYDSFDNEVLKAEKILIHYLDSLHDQSLLNALEDLNKFKTIDSLLKNLLKQIAEDFPVQEKRSALFLSNHVQRNTNSISDNIEHFGTTYENQSINLKYLFELVIPNDLVDLDIIEARDYLNQEMEKYNVVKNYLLVDKYYYASPDQLMLEILRQMKYFVKAISLRKNILRALRMHADFWRKSQTIDNVSDFLSLFSAYDNLIDNPEFKEFFELMSLIKEKLKNSRNVNLELTCMMPRPCLRRILLKVLECSMIDNDTKAIVLKFMNWIDLKGTPILLNKSLKNLDYNITNLKLIKQPNTTNEDTKLSTERTVPNAERNEFSLEPKLNNKYVIKNRPKHKSNRTKKVKPIKNISGEEDNKPRDKIENSTLSKEIPKKYQVLPVDKPKTLLPQKCDGINGCHQESDFTTDYTLPGHENDYINDSSPTSPFSNEQKKSKHIKNKNRGKYPKNSEEKRRPHDKQKLTTMLPFTNEDDDKMIPLQPTEKSTTVTFIENSPDLKQHVEENITTTPKDTSKQIGEEISTTAINNQQEPSEESIANAPASGISDSDEKLGEHSTNLKGPNIQTSSVEESPVSASKQNSLIDESTPITPIKDKDVRPQPLEESTTFLPIHEKKIRNTPKEENMTDILIKSDVTSKENDEENDANTPTNNDQMSNQILDQNKILAHEQSISNEDCKNNENCVSEKCNGDQCLNASSEECSYESCEQSTEKPCTDVDCSVTSSFTDCQTNPNEKCNTGNLNNCTNGNCVVPMQSASLSISTPTHHTENSTEHSTPKNCEGQNCSNEKNCDSNNCEGESIEKCEGLNCPTATENCEEEEDCTKDNVNADFDINSTGEESILSSDLICDAKGCYYKTTTDCTGLNCKSTKPGKSLPCSSDNCSEALNETCTGSDCTILTENKTQSPVMVSKTEIPNLSTFLKPSENGKNKKKLCSTKDPHRKLKLERLQKIRKLSDSLARDDSTSLENDKQSVNKQNQKKYKSKENFDKTNIGPILEKLSKYEEKKNINEKNIKKPENFQTNWLKKHPKKSIDQEIDDSHSNYKTNSNTRRKLNLKNLKNLNYDYEDAQSLGAYTINTKPRTEHSKDTKNYDLNNKMHNNFKNVHEPEGSEEYYEYTSMPQLYQTRPHPYSRKTHN